MTKFSIRVTPGTPSVAESRVAAHHVSSCFAADSGSPSVESGSLENRTQSLRSPRSGLHVSCVAACAAIASSTRAMVTTHRAMDGSNTSTPSTSPYSPNDSLTASVETPTHGPTPLTKRNRVGASECRGLLRGG